MRLPHLAIEFHLAFDTHPIEPGPDMTPMPLDSLVDRAHPDDVPERAELDGRRRFGFGPGEGQ